MVAFFKELMIISIALTLFDSCHCLECHAGTPTLGKLTKPNLGTTVCKAPWFEQSCYVMYTDYHDYDLDAWTYGCIFKVIWLILTQERSK